MSEVNFTHEELVQAKQTSLTQVATHCGYTVFRMGNHYSLKEMDSVRIHNDRTWYRWSNKTGGSQIDFLKEFCGMTTVEAVKKLCDMQGFIINKNLEVSYPKNEEKKDFSLPEKAQNYKRLYAYLIHTRGLSYEVVNMFVQKKLIYESAGFHNIVFIGKNPDGEAKFASMRGTLDAYGKVFKGDVEGSDKNYCFNLANEKSDILNVFEAAIDMMSYIELYDSKDQNYLALGMLADNPLERFLEDHPNIKKINFCLDNDEPAKAALYENNEEKDGLIRKYEKLGYELTITVPESGKDFNEHLQEIKKNTTIKSKTK